MQWFMLLDLSDFKEKWPTKFCKNAKLKLLSSSSVGSINLPKSYRLSPIFPISNNAWETKHPISNETDNYVDFYIFKNPYRNISRILNKLETDLHKHLVFGLGAIPFLTISQDQGLADKIISLLKPETINIERWCISREGFFKSIIPPNSSNILRTHFREYRPKNYDRLPSDICGIIDEFLGSIDILIPPLEKSLPIELNTYRKINEEIIEMIDEIKKCQNHSSKMSDIDLTKNTHQRTDRIVQINSALSYISSQLTTGLPPILERRSLIRRYSLLGIGNATRAITAIARHVEKAFAKGQIELILKEDFNRFNSKKIPGLFTKDGYDSSEWKRFNVVKFETSNRKMTRPPKMAYFSGRLGFSEAEFAVSSAIQSLWCGDSIEWNLITMTHEILHGHVRNIMSHIFKGTRSKSSTEFKDMYENLCDLFKFKNPSLSTIESLQMIILSYCAQSVNWGSLNSLSEPNKIMRDKVSFSIPDRIKLHDILQNQNRNICEIIVHVLDFHYFYGSRINIYIHAIWRSWAVVPSVLKDVRQYILRSLLAISSKTSGTAYSRFLESKKLFGKSIKGINELSSSSSSSSPLIKKVVDFLDDQDKMLELSFAFDASLRIVDFTREILLSKTILSSLSAGDKHIKKINKGGSEGDIEHNFEYDIAELDFLEDIIASPTAFLLDRLQRLLENNVNSMNIERRTAWVFLALSSSLGD